MRQSKRRDVVTADEFEEMLKSLSTPHAMERLDLWDRPVDGSAAESDDDDSEAGAADVAGEVVRLRASMVEACAAALEACGAPPSDTTDDDDVSARAKRSRRRKVETFGKQETAVADLEAAVAAAGFYVADGVAGVDDGARAELAIYREAAFWLRALLRFGLRLRCERHCLHRRGRVELLRGPRRARGLGGPTSRPTADRPTAARATAMAEMADVIDFADPPSSMKGHRACLRCGLVKCFDQRAPGARMRPRARADPVSAAQVLPGRLRELPLPRARGAPGPRRELHDGVVRRRRRDDEARGVVDRPLGGHQPEPAGLLRHEAHGRDARADPPVPPRQAHQLAGDAGGVGLGKSSVALDDAGSPHWSDSGSRRIGATRALAAFERRRFSPN